MPKFAPLYHHMLYNFGNAISFSIYYQKMHIHRLLRRRLHKLTILQCIEIIFFGTCISKMNSKSILFEHEYLFFRYFFNTIQALRFGKYQKMPCNHCYFISFINKTFYDFKWFKVQYVWRYGKVKTGKSIKTYSLGNMSNF